MIPLAQTIRGKRGADPHWDSVISLLRFQGANGSTTFTDEKGLSWSGVGTAQLSTANFIDGVSSLLLDGVDDYIQHDPVDHSVWDFGTGNLTIEAWIKSPIGDGEAIVSKRSAGAVGWGIDVIPGGTVRFRSKIGGVWGDTTITSGGSIFVPENEWCHVAIVRSGNDWLVFIGGVLANTVTVSGALENETTNVRIGTTQGVAIENPFNGYVGSVRITKGVARYTSNFTPPTSFPTN